MNYDTWLMSDRQWDRFHHFEERSPRYKERERTLENRIDRNRDHELKNQNLQRRTSPMDGMTFGARARIHNEEITPEEIRGCTASDDYDFALVFYQRLPEQLKNQFLKERLNELDSLNLQLLLNGET